MTTQYLSEWLSTEAMEPMRPKLNFLSSLPVNGYRKLGKLLFSLGMRKKNSNGSISNKETEIGTQVFLLQKTTYSEKSFPNFKKTHNCLSFINELGAKT